MSLLDFSTFLSVGVLGLLSLCILALVAYFLIPAVRAQIHTRTYYFYLALAGAIAAVSTICVLYYQYIFNLEVCELCWWQRIFMFPIEVIVFIALWHRQKAAHITVAILAAVGAAIAAHHYWNHFQNLVLGKEVVLPCGQIGLVPSCSEFAFTIFGFFTIPGMALAAFLSILILMFFAHKTQLDK